MKGCIVAWNDTLYFEKSNIYVCFCESQKSIADQLRLIYRGARSYIKMHIDSRSRENI